MKSPKVLRLALFAAPLLLGACDTLNSIDFNPKPPPPPPCPRAVVGEDVGRLTRFSGAGKDPADVVFQAEIGDLTGSCIYDDDKIEVEMQVQITATRGPAATGDTAKFNYFVAVARNDKTILSRDSFDAEIKLPGDEPRNGTADEIDQTIPVPNSEAGGDLTIIVGFEMTPDELEYNRKQRR